jgi:GT2 family glycosyltransferase
MATMPTPSAHPERAGSPCVAISLVTHDGLRWLPNCWKSILAQEVAWHRLVVLDNASTDGTAAWLQRELAGDDRVVITCSSVNLGFARAHNQNLARIACEAVLVLNQDTELDRAFLGAAVAALARHPEAAAVQGRLLRLGGPGQRTSTIDTTGLEVNRYRRFFSRGQGQEDGAAYGKPGPVFGADGPAPVYRRAALLESRLPATRGGREIFDEDFFLYHEDSDLAWRLARLGWTAWYEPTAVGWHARGVPGAPSRSPVAVARATRRQSRRARLLGWRNQRLMQVKNDPLRDFVRDAPWIVSRELVTLGAIVFTDPIRLTALPSLIRALPGAMRKRAALGRIARSPTVRSRLAARSRGAEDGMKRGAPNVGTARCP